MTARTNTKTGTVAQEEEEELVATAASAVFFPVLLAARVRSIPMPGRRYRRKRPGSVGCGRAAGVSRLVVACSVAIPCGAEAALRRLLLRGSNFFVLLFPKKLGTVYRRDSSIIITIIIMLTVAEVKYAVSALMTEYRDACFRISNRPDLRYECYLVRGDDAAWKWPCAVQSALRAELREAALRCADAVDNGSQVQAALGVITSLASTEARAACTTLLASDAGDRLDASLAESRFLEREGRDRLRCETNTNACQARRLVAVSGLSEAAVRTEAIFTAVRCCSQLHVLIRSTLEARRCPDLKAVLESRMDTCMEQQRGLTDPAAARALYRHLCSDRVLEARADIYRTTLYVECDPYVTADPVRVKRAWQVFLRAWLMAAIPVTGTADLPNRAGIVAVAKHLVPDVPDAGTYVRRMTDAIYAMIPPTIEAAAMLECVRCEGVRDDSVVAPPPAHWVPFLPRNVFLH